MIVKDGLKFNCCESVLMITSGQRPLPGYDKATLRIASNLGGGIAGWGDMCGALVGGVIAIALVHGTNGNEPKHCFDDLRLRERRITQELIEGFKERWGYVGCRNLLGCEGCTPEERAKRGEDLRARGESHCDEYVDWIATKTIEILKRNQ
jgi:C_GCAxxG_C_C family probable redox protein